jgi:hypothetical protein
MALDTLIHDVVSAFNDARPAIIPSFIGEKHIAQHDTPPRLVWVPFADTFGPPVQVGANPKSYATRVAGVDCAVWGEDLAKTEEMVNDLIVALHRECVSRGNYELRGGEWITAGELTNNGIVYLLHLAIDVPIVGKPAIPVRPKTEASDYHLTP